MARRRKRPTGTIYDPDALLKKTRLRIDEAAELLDVSPRTIQSYMSTGKIAYTATPGGQRRPLTASVRKYIP